MIPGFWGQVPPIIPVSKYIDPFWPWSSQNDVSYANTTFAASAWRWRSSESIRSRETPSTAIRRSGPTGTADTTASQSKRSPVSVVTEQPLEAMRMLATGQA